MAFQRYKTFIVPLQTKWLSFLRPTTARRFYERNFTRVLVERIRNRRLKEQKTCRFCSVTIKSDPFLNFSESDEDPETDESLDIMRTDLYPSASEGNLKKLLLVKNIEEFFDELSNNLDDMNEKYCSQAVVTIWDLQKKLIGHSHEEQINFIATIKSNEYFKLLLEDLSKSFKCMPNEALTSVLLSLKKLGLWDSEIFNEILEECLLRIPHFNLNSLSRFAVSISKLGRKGLIAQSYIPDQVKRSLAVCHEEEELKCIAICMINSPLFSNDLLFMFTEKVEELLKCGKLSDPSVILKCFRVLINNPELNYKSLFKELSMKLQESLEYFSIRQITSLSETLQFAVGETAGISLSVSNHAEKLLQENVTSLEKLELLSCLTSDALKKFEKEAIEIIEEAYPKVFLPHALIRLSKIFKILHRSDLKILEKFWDAAAKYIGLIGNQYERNLSIIYSRFKILFYGEYSHKNLEELLRETLLKHFGGTWGLIPKDILNVCVFFLICNINKPIPDYIVNKTLTIIPQLSIDDIFLLSKALNVALKKRNNQYNLHHSIALSQQLEKEIPNKLENINSLPSLTRLTGAFINRHGVTSSPSFEDIMDKYHKFLNQFTVKTLAATSQHVSSSLYYSPVLLDMMAEYVIRNQYIPAWTAVLVLFACYRVCHYPSAEEEFLDICLNMINRDFSHLSGYNILQAALALSLFQYLPSSLVNQIFSTSFMEKLDLEIQKSISDIYSSRIRNALMELNRIVCLEYPEYEVPWFHEKYCLNHVLNSPLNENSFHREVYSALCQVVGGSHFIKAHSYSPYFYHISFECLLNSHKQPLSFAEYGNISWGNIPADDIRLDRSLKEFPQGSQRVAVNILQQHNYCLNVRHLQGGLHLKKRHLELMNYKVVDIPYYEFNSMQLSELGARIRYLQRKIL